MNVYTSDSLSLLESSGGFEFVESVDTSPASVAIDVGSGCLIFSAILPLHFAAAFAAAAAFFAASARALPSSP